MNLLFRLVQLNTHTHQFIGENGLDNRIAWIDLGRKKEPILPIQEQVFHFNFNFSRSERARDMLDIVNII